MSSQSPSLPRPLPGLSISRLRRHINQTAAAITTCLGLALFTMTTTAQEAPPENDRQAILAMAGEYEVLFHFKEKVALQPGYELTGAYEEDATELVLLVEDSGSRIVLQHLLMVDADTVVKHWKQIWTWQDTQLIEFQGGTTWKIRELSEETARGSWSQLVTQTDDSPRYEGFGKWRHDGGFSRWESAPTNRPLPRREHTKRDDYHILLGVNRHAITPTGWIHEQDNLKQAIDGDGQVLRYLAREYGDTPYNRITGADFSPAKEYWEKTRSYWETVTRIWEKIALEKRQYTVIEKIDDQSVMSQLNEWASKLVKGEGEAPSEEEIEKLIRSYVK